MNRARYIPKTQGIYPRVKHGKIRVWETKKIQGEGLTHLRRFPEGGER